MEFVVSLEEVSALSAEELIDLISFCRSVESISFDVVFAVCLRLALLHRSGDISDSDYMFLTSALDRLDWGIE